jgi:hypothetical protein
MSNLVKTDSSIFSTIASFEDGQRIAKGLASSDLVPQAYKGNIPNTMIALEMAARIGVSAFMVMQNLDIIQGKPSWRSSFIIAALNSCGRFKPLKFEFIGTDPQSDSYGCRAYTDDFDGNRITGPLVTWLMVKSEGWLSKAGSKWKTMPELMFQYRAASFFGRLYAPDILNGMQSVEEVKDVLGTIDTEYEDVSKHEKLIELFELKKELISETDLAFVEKVIKDKDKSNYDKVIYQLNKLKNEQQAK